MGTMKLLAAWLGSGRDRTDVVQAMQSSAELSNRLLSFCDQPIGNSWTVRVPGDGTIHKYMFLCGCWKSGTHWVQNVLNLHPLIRMKGEYHFEHLQEAMDSFTGLRWCVASHPRGRRVANAAFENLIRRVIYATATRDRPKAIWLGDRTPRRLRALLPGAPMFWIVRDGRDILVSWAFHWLRIDAVPPAFIREPLTRWREEFRTDPDRFRDPDYGLLGNSRWVRRIAREWARFILHDFEAYPRLVAAGTPIFKVVYEEMHRRPHEVAREMYEFLGLDPAQAEPLSRETNTLPGFKSEDLTKALRKGQSGDWRNYFNDRIKRIFKEEAGEALILAGYEKDLNW